MNKMDNDSKEELYYLMVFLVMFILAIISMLWLVAMLKKYPDGLPWL